MGFSLSDHEALSLFVATEGSILARKIRKGFPCAVLKANY
jgi:hypothetical protein